MEFLSLRYWLVFLTYKIFLRRGISTSNVWASNLTGCAWPSCDSPCWVLQYFAPTHWVTMCRKPQKWRTKAARPVDIRREEKAKKTKNSLDRIFYYRWYQIIIVDVRVRVRLYDVRFCLVSFLLLSCTTTGILIGLVLKSKLVGILCSWMRCYFPTPPPVHCVDSSLSWIWKFTGFFFLHESNVALISFKLTRVLFGFSYVRSCVKMLTGARFPLLHVHLNGISEFYFIFSCVGRTGGRYLLPGWWTKSIV